MLEIISEWSTIYFKLGACFGFGFGALAQIYKDTARRWTLVTCIILTLVWPWMFVEAWTGRKK